MTSSSHGTRAPSEGVHQTLLHVLRCFIEERGAHPEVQATGASFRMRRMVADLPRDRQRLLGLGVRALGMMARIRHGRSFRNLSPDEGRVLLDRLATSRWASLRRLHFSLKILTQYAYFADPATWSASGYDGPWIGRRPVDIAPGPTMLWEELGS